MHGGLSNKINVPEMINSLMIAVTHYSRTCFYIYHCFPNDHLWTSSFPGLLTFTSWTEREIAVFCHFTELAWLAVITTGLSYLAAALACQQRTTRRLLQHCDLER